MALASANAAATRANSGAYPVHNAHHSTVKATTTVWLTRAPKRVDGSNVTRDPSVGQKLRVELLRVVVVGGGGRAEDERRDEERDEEERPPRIDGFRGSPRATPPGLVVVGAAVDDDNLFIDVQATATQDK